MHVMLADSIDGGILALLIFIGGLAASALASGALIPATQGRKVPTLCSIAPTLVYAVLVTFRRGYGYVRDEMHNPDFDFGHDLFLPGAFLASPAFATSLPGVTVLLLKCKGKA